MSQGSISPARRRAARRDGAVPYLFISPFLLSFLAFFLFPAVYSFALSFYRYKGFGKARFVGVSNYLNLLRYGTMWSCLLNTLTYFVLSFVPVMIIAFGLALVVRSERIRKYQRIYKPIVFLPQVCAVVAASLVFRVIFSGSVGVINQLLGTQIPFLHDTALMKWPIVSMLVWRSTGWFFVIYLAGLTTVSEEVEEAAVIDGANAWQRTFRVTIPMMRPIFMFAFITSAIGSLKIYTEPNLISGPDGAPLQIAPYVDLIVTSINGGNFGMAAATGWFLFLIIAALTMAQVRMFGFGKGGSA